jgi:hypothetical protein
VKLNVCQNALLLDRSVQAGVTVTSNFNKFSNLQIFASTSGGSPSFGTTSNVTAAAAVLAGATPTVSSGELGLGITTATTATSGSATLPGAPAGFLEINIGGTVQKLPYYNA